MEFFNRKEEVLDIELTQYGKYLLSVGKFKPSYYAFFDDDVIYDLQYQGNPPNDTEDEISPTENQKDSQKRIQETPRIKSQHNFVTVDKTHIQTSDANEDSMFKVVVMGRKTVESEVEKEINFAYPINFKDDYCGVILPLGTSDYSSIYAPAWQINFMQGELKRSVSHDGGDGDEKYGIKRIPQLEVEVAFNTSVGYNNQSDLSLNIAFTTSPKRI